MHLLILSTTFFPEENPRANRWWPIVAAMAQEGHQITIIARRVHGLPDEVQIHHIHIYRVGWPLLEEKWRPLLSKSSPIGWVVRRMQHVRHRVWKKLWWPDSSLFWFLPATRAARRYIQQHALDGIISISLPFVAHLVALNIKIKYPSLYWIADHGDPFSLKNLLPQNNHTLYHRLNRRAEKAILRHANHHFVNTPALAAYYHRQANLTTQLDIIAHPALTRYPSKPSAISQTLPITFTYFGSLFTEGRDPSAFFHFLAYFQQQFPHWKRQLQPAFYGPLPPSPVWGYIRQLSHTASLAKMGESQILLSLGYSQPYMLPMKLMEYIGSQRPILHIATHMGDPVLPFLDNEPCYCNLLIPDISYFPKAALQLHRFLTWLIAHPTWTPPPRPELHPFAIAQQYLNAIKQREP